MRGRLLLAFLVVLGSTPRAQDAERTDPGTLKTQIERALDAAPRDYERLLAPRQTGVRVLSVDVRDTRSTEAITVDLSQRALTYDPSGNIEPLLDAIIEVAASAIAPKQLVEYTFTIEGLPIDQSFRARLDYRARRSPSPLAALCSSVPVMGCTGTRPWRRGTFSGRAFEGSSKTW